MKEREMQLQETAAALDYAAAEFAQVIKSEPSFKSRSLTAVIDGSKWSDVTLYATSGGPTGPTCRLSGFGDAICEPAWLSLAFRMGMMRALHENQVMELPEFTKMSPELLEDLHGLARYSLAMFNPVIDFSVSAEWSTDASGLIGTMLHTSGRTGNVYRTNISRMSRSLRSDDVHFALFDGVRYGSVLIM